MFTSISINNSVVLQLPPAAGQKPPQSHPNPKERHILSKNMHVLISFYTQLQLVQITSEFQCYLALCKTVSGQVLLVWVEEFSLSTNISGIWLIKAAFREKY